VVLCAAVCCCRDVLRRSRLRELASGPSVEEEEAKLSRLITGYQAPIRRLDPFAFRKGKVKGNNAQANYDKVTSSADDHMDYLVRAYGSLAAEIDPKDRLKLLFPAAKRNESTISKGARSLEDEHGEAPSRQVGLTVGSSASAGSKSSAEGKGKGKATLTHAVYNDARGRRQRIKETHVPPQVLGRQDDVSLKAFPDDSSDVGGCTASRTGILEVLRHVDLPPLPPAHPQSFDTSEPAQPVQCIDKFDALDAELAEHLHQSSGLALDPATLHKSTAGLPSFSASPTRKPKSKARSKRSGSAGPR